MIYKDSRPENVISVVSLNVDVSEFIARFSGELPNITTWPRIHLPETIHPLVTDPSAVVDVHSVVVYLLNSMRPVTSKFIMALINGIIITGVACALALQEEVCCPSKVHMVREAFMKNRARVWHIINISPSEISENLSKIKPHFPILLMR